MKQIIIVAIAAVASLSLGAPAIAQDRDECITTQISGATIEDVPGLIADAACLARLNKNMSAQMQSRLEKAAEILAATPVDPPVEPEPSEDRHPITPIASNFNRDDFLGLKGIPPSAAPDVVGAFRFLCQPSHLAWVDPIVYPGSKTKSHLHQFFGNPEVDENTTYESLRTTGDSTCMNKLNRSAYWIPAMMDGRGNVVVPDFITVYYKRYPDPGPFCGTVGECVPQPDGIKAIFGYDMLGDNHTGNAWVRCNNTRYEAGEPLPDDCGAEVKLTVNTQICWNGVDLDSPDHRSHFADPIRNNSTGWQSKCPETHPKLVPTFTLTASYTTDENFPEWRLSSDEMAGTVQFASFHTDLWDAWDGPTKQAWTDGCINQMLNCSDGDLGQGQIMKRWAGYGLKADPRLVAVPDNHHSGH